AENGGIELGPTKLTFFQGGGVLLFVPQAPGVASGANSDQRLAGRDVLTQSVELLFWRQAAADAHENEVRVFHGLGHAWEIVLILRIGVNDRDIKAKRLELRFGKRR